MPQHEVGYRPWDGHRTPSSSRWWIIAEKGFHLVLKSMWVKRLLFLAWLPIFYWGTIFFFVENVDNFIPGNGQAQLQELINTEGMSDEEIAQLEKALEHEIFNQANQMAQQNVERRALRRTLSMLPGGDSLTEAIYSDDPNVRRSVSWRWILMTFFRYPQALMIIFLLGFISPGLISRDLRSRAYLFYFSKPIGRIEYIMGKFAIPAVYLMLVTTLPALILYMLGVSLSPDLSVIYVTWDIPFRILLCSLVLIIPTALLSLMLSSLTQESRFASFAWFAVWLLGHGAWLAIWIGRAIQSGVEPPDIVNDLVVQRWSFLSLYNNLGNVQSWIFGLDTFNNAIPGIFVLSLLTVVSIVVLFRRVSAPIRV